MSCSVNLIPTTRAHARVRARRRAGWIAAGLIAALLLASGWGAQQLAARGLTRLSQQVASLQAQRAQLRHRLAATSAEGEELLARLQTVAAARRPQSWARRLVQLTQAAPDDVFLTQLSIALPEAPPGTVRPPLSERRSIPSLSEPEPPQPKTQEVRLRGYALDHANLIQLLNAVQSLPDWQQLELVRATLEPYQGGFAVAFELSGRTLEDAP